MFTESRKRKQQDVCDKLSSSMPNTSSWSDFIYSSPSSPSVENASADNAHMLNFDSLFDQPPADPHSGANSRRHSVAVGEMDYHSFDFSKQDMNVLPASSWDADLQMLLNNAHAESAAEQRPVHRRAMSLRIDDTHHPMSFSQATTGPTFFTPNFLDALVADNQRDFAGGLSMDEGSDAATMVSDMSFMDSNDILSTTGSFLDMSTSELSTNNMTNNNNTNTTNLVTPSSITNEINSMADWLLEQQQTKENTQAQKRQRRMHPDESSLSPISPAQTMGSSMSSMSPSPPITPMQPVSVGFDQQQQQHQQQQQPGQDGEWGLNSLSTLNKPVIQSLKPLVQNYLLQKSHQDRSIPIQGESTVMVLTSKVAQKSYGTEKR